MRILVAFVGAVLMLAAGLGVFVLIEIIDRHSGSPIMRSRINEASDKFFAERGTIFQAALRRGAEFARNFSSRGSLGP